MAPLSRFASKNPYAALFESSPAEGSGRIAATVPHPRLQFPEVMPSTAESGLRRAKVLCKDMEDLSIQLEYQLFEVQNADEDASEEDLDGEGETTDGMKEEKSKKEVQSVEAKELTGNGKISVLYYDSDAHWSTSPSLFGQTYGADHADSQCSEFYRKVFRTACSWTESTYSSKQQSYRRKWSPWRPCLSAGRQW